MVLNDFGLLVKNEWVRTSQIRPNVIVDEYIVMPNHLHGILVIVDNGGDATCWGVSPYAPTTTPYAPATTPYAPEAGLVAFAV
ncbi:MAG: hypothetical protein D6675_13975 [Gemmatimonadetes bacterium]|nr:MAG: hypothetical protein D6675_13975 [Gemmatimonadota bacterium]